MTSSAPVNVSDLIDRSRLGPFQIRVFTLCGLCMILDGFDVLAMSYAAPTLIQEWRIAKASLGPVFGAGLFGMLVGSLGLSVVADRIGRRPVLIGATLFSSLGMLATARAGSVGELLALRFVTGIGLGAIIPNAVTLAGEYSPVRIRVSLMMIISLGFTVGGVLGGALSAVLIPAFGWRSVFYVGALAPLLLAGVMIFSLPESLPFLVLRGRRPSQARAWLKRVEPTLRIADHTPLVVREPDRRGLPVGRLFRDGMALGTLLLWLLNFMNLLSIFSLSHWLPVVMQEAGHSTAGAVLAGGTLWIGGLIGTPLLGWLVGRHDFPAALTAAFGLAALAIAAIGPLQASLLAPVTILIAGGCVLGGQSALNALAATYYPTALRATGMGWSLGIGRLGSIAGPVIGGELLRLDWPVDRLFIAAAIPPALAALSALALRRVMAPTASATLSDSQSSGPDPERTGPGSEDRPP